MAAVSGAARTIVLAINSGSSSLKFGLFDTNAGTAVLLTGGTIETTDHEAALEQVAADLHRHGGPAPTAIGHRIVHGAPRQTRHCLIDEQVMHDLDAACAFAPVHGPAAIALIRSAQCRYPGVPQVACVDTAFHATLPDVARTLPIPRAHQAEGIRRYGFHGLSCQSILRQLGGSCPKRLVIAHLGSGASVTAVLDGRSIDTTMGLTPSGGIVMETRTGDIDPGVLLYLAREHHLQPPELAHLVDHESGMLGISGMSGDVRRLRAVSHGDADADLAIRIFERSVSKAIAAMATSLGGVDLVVLTGGIGENDTELAHAVERDLAWLPGLRIATYPSRENEEIALATALVISAA